MFRIKTDIRQYQCESREKVERLIRNWVIRPTDLIFDDDQQRWGPIGEHAAFVSTFAELAKGESKLAEALSSEGTDPDNSSVARRDDRELDPPDAPERVERESASPDEVTVMTEETLETILDDKEAGQAPVETCGERQEETQVTEPEVTRPRASRPAIGEETDQSVGPDEETDPRVRPIEGGEVGSGPRVEEKDVGRHDLPEEIFATNELEKSSAPAADGSEADGSGYTEVEEALQENARQARRQQDVDDEWDEILERLRETDELSKDELDEITQTRDQIAIGRDEGEDDLDATEIPEQVEEYVSEGYQTELPADVGPSRRDLQLGLRRSQASKAAKDRVFPYPSPKKEGRVERHVYRLRTPDDPSLKVVVGVIGAVISLIVVAVLAF